jgi:ATP-dependent metalloprotease
LSLQFYSGKTLLAKAVAGEAGVPFFAASGSEFEEMFVGVGAKRIRELFANAKKRAPAIIFIDEVDAVGGKRTQRDLSSTRMSLNQLLVEMDGFNESSGVVVIAATNFPQMLDPALTRPGRFDKHVTVPLPDVRGRTEILSHYGNKVQMSPDVDLSVVARGTPGASGADLYNLINSAAIRASALGHAGVTMEDMEFARDKILMGAERKTHVMAESERKNTAYHEGGHALVALHTDGADPLHKATILPRGMALGLTHLLPEADVYSRSRRQLLAQLDVCMGGRIAEEMIQGHDGVTTGASNDLETATKIARRMVLEFGMGETGSLPYRTAKSEDDLKMMSAEAKKELDSEINRILRESYERARRILAEHRDELERLAAALLKYETLDREQIIAAVRGEKIPHLSTYLHAAKPPVVPTPTPTPIAGAPATPSAGVPAVSRS